EINVIHEFVEKLNHYTYLQPFLFFLTTSNSLLCLYSNIFLTNGKRSLANPFTSTTLTCPLVHVILKSAVYVQGCLLRCPVPLHVRQLIGLPVFGDLTLPTMQRPHSMSNVGNKINLGCNSMSCTSCRVNKCL